MNAVIRAYNSANKPCQAAFEYLDISAEFGQRFLCYDPRCHFRFRSDSDVITPRNLIVI